MFRCCALGAVVLLLACLGCREAHAPPGLSDRAVAKQVLTQSLDAWKAGTNPETLRSSQPQIFVSDLEWNEGAQLSSYELQNEGEPYGPYYRFLVLVDVRHGTNPSVKKAVEYLVGTNPHSTVSRNDPYN